jgi:plasmid stabilization system protein ParE
MELTPLAKAQLREIFEYIATEFKDKEAAKRSVKIIENAIYLIGLNPGIGVRLYDKVLDLPDNFPHRIFVSKRYKIIYVVKETTIYITHILGKRQDFYNLF